MVRPPRTRALAAAAVAATLALTAIAASSHAATVETPSSLPANTAPILIGPWSAGERSAIDRASRKIPDEILVRAPATIVRDATDCRDVNGWRDGSDSDIVGDRGRIHLCAPAPGVTAGDVARQVTEARLFAFDRAAGWSDDPAWRRLNRWRREPTAGFALRTANLDPRGFASPRGRRSPRWDLVTFLAALLLDAPGDDGSIGCRLISQAQFIRARVSVPIGPARCTDFEAWADLDQLAGVEVVLAAPSTAMLGSLFGHLFLRLVYRDGDTTPPHLSRTVAFLADNDVPFTEDPTYAVKGIVGSYAASLHERPFLDAYRDYVVAEGRDLRRWRLNLTAGQRRALLERIWTAGHGTKVAYYFFRRNCATLMVDLVDDIRAPVAQEDDAAPGWLAAPPATTLEPWADARGADGAPLLQFVPEPIDSFEHRARDAARARLALEPALLAALPPPASQRAAAALRDVHASAPPVRAGGYRRLADLLGDARAGRATDLRAWLNDSATIETHLSALANLEAEARDDRQRRERVRAARDAVTARVTSDARAWRSDGDAARIDLGARLERALDRLASSSADARLDGYRALLELTRTPGIDPALASRMRLLALLQSELRFDVVRMKAEPGLRDALLFTDPHQPIERQAYLAGYESLLDLPCETRVSQPLRSLQQTKQALFAARRLAAADEEDARAIDAGAPTATETLAAQRQQREERDYQASLPHSGIDRFAVLGGVAAGAGAPRAGLLLNAALYDEELGDHHRFGFPNDTALVVGRSTLFLALGSTPAIAAYDARVVGYRSLRAPLPEAGNGRWPLGWELYATLEGDRARALASAPKVGWGLLAPLAQRGELTDHALVGLSIAYAAYFPEAGAAVDRAVQAISAPLALELRTGLGAEPRYRSWCGARAWIEPMAALADGRARFESEAGARIEVALAVGSGTRLRGIAHDPAISIQAQILRTTLTFARTAAPTEALIGVGVDLR